MFAAFDRRIADLRKEKARQEKLLANLDAPRIAMEQAAQQLAELEAQRAAAEAERDNLLVVAADLRREIDGVTSTDAEITTALKVLAEHERVYGSSHNVYARAIATLQNDVERRAAGRRKLNEATARLKELDQ